MKRGWPERWQQPGAWAIVLAPLSWAYGLLWRLNWAWKTRQKPVAVQGLRVLSVGNLSVGGTGKSALVRVVAQAALKKRRKVAVLLRGYGAQAGPRPLWVSKGSKALVSEALSGDEAQEHARLKGLAVLIDSDRLRGAREARAQGFDTLILDDGFQRRWQVARDCDLLLATGPEIARGERLLPWGPWREPWSQAASATALLLQDGRAEALPKAWKSLPRLDVGYVPKALLQWRQGRLSPGPRLSVLKGKRVLALSGLGQPFRFEASLAGLGASVLRGRFGDHHVFTLAELERLPLHACRAIVTTVKDAMRLPQGWKAPVPVWVLEAELKSQPETALKKLLKKVLR